jgi:hypothetical protein
MTHQAPRPGDAYQRVRDVEQPDARSRRYRAEERHQWVEEERGMQRVRQAQAEVGGPEGVVAVEQCPGVKHQADDDVAVLLVVHRRAADRPEEQ